MSGIGLIILVTLTLEFALIVTADYLNLKSLQQEPPEEFKDVYNEEPYLRSKEYLKVNTRFGWITVTVNLILLLAFWFAHGFQLLDEWVRSWGFSPVPAGVLYIGTLSTLAAAVSIPFSVYATFRIEERFGFNQTTWATYIKDKIKGFFLSVVLGVPILAGVLAFFEFAGPAAWLYCWGAVTIYMLMVQFVAPAWIMPLFNRFTVLQEGELRQAIINYARSVRFPLDNIFVMDGSRRSSKSNAFFTGFGRYKRITLFDTLIDRHSTAELVAILAHEMGHFKKKHILKSILIGVVQTGVMFFLISVVLSYPGIYKAFYIEIPAVYTGLVVFALLYSPLDLVSGIFLKVLSRKNEYEADRFAVDTTGAPSAMTEALKKLSVHHLSHLNPHPLYVILHYSHPPVLERIRAIKRDSTAGLDPALEY